MYAQKRPIENSHITRERDRRRFRELLAVLSLGVPLGLFLLLFTWQNLEVFRLGSQATRLHGELKQLNEENKRLRVTIEQLTSLAGVEQKAMTLGLVPTEGARVVSIIPPAQNSTVTRTERRR